MTVDPSMIDAIAQMMKASGIQPDDLSAALDGNADAAPTIAECVEPCLAALKAEASRRSYRTHLRRLCEGVSPVCSCMCEACSIAYADTGDCAWLCKDCNTNPLSFTGIGDKPMRDASVVFSDLERFVALAERIARKRSIRDNAVRRARGLGEMATHGQSARSMCVHALSRLFGTARRDRHLTWNPADDLKAGDAVDTKRRALTDNELSELFDVVVSGGNDPELDLLIVWASLEMGNRRGGLLTLRIGDLNIDRQLVTVHEKRDKDRQQPASVELLTALHAHAVRRGGSRCIVGHPDFDPTSPVLYYRNSTPERPHPLERKRFETLHKRIQRALPWANDMNFSVHVARHTAGTLVERIAGTQVARKFLGHGTRKVTDTYTNASDAEIASAFSAMTGRTHPASQTQPGT
jgi:integrase